MLARSAEGLYWMGRYLERAENVCRLLRVQMDMLLDRPVREINFGWLRIYGALWRHPPGPAIGFAGADDDYALADSFTLADDLTFERTNPGAVRNSFANSRENARQMRHCISGETWTCLNLAWLRLRTKQIEDIWETAPEAFYADLAREIDTLWGVVDTTMYRDDGWRFLHLGRGIERIQSTTALLLAHLKGVQAQDDPSEAEWSSLLRICHAFDGYRQCYGVEYRPERILDFLVTDPLLPRSLCCTIDTAAARLGALALGPGPVRAARECAAELGGAVRRQWPAPPTLGDHAAHLRHIEARSRALHDLVVAAHVGYGKDGAAG